MGYMMEPHLCLKLLNSRRLFFGLFLLLASHSLLAQTEPIQAGPIQAGPIQAGPIQAGPPLDSLSLYNVVAVSQDALGNIYLATAEGELVKLNEQLAIEQRYSSANLSGLTSLEAAQMLKIFTFYQNSQQFQFFDRFLTPSQTNTIKTRMPSYFSAATLSNDQMLWLFDDTHLQLIKYNPILEDVVMQTDIQYFLPADAQVKSLKEYGNRLYLWQNDEIVVFDFLGNLIQKLPVEVEKPFSFYENQLYYPVGKGVYVYDLLSMQQKKYAFSLLQEIRFVVRTKKRLYIITKDQVKIFQAEP